MQSFKVGGGTEAMPWSSPLQDEKEITSLLFSTIHSFFSQQQSDLFQHPTPKTPHCSQAHFRQIWDAPKFTG